MRDGVRKRTYLEIALRGIWKGVRYCAAFIHTYIHTYIHTPSVHGRHATTKTVNYGDL